MRRRVAERIVGQEREFAAIVVQKFPDQMQRPRIFGGRGHRCEPDLPVDARLIWRDDRRVPPWIARFRFEFVFLPFGVAGDECIVCSLENDFGTFPAHASERAVSVDKIKRIERRVHQLARGNQVGYRRDAQIRNQNGQCDSDAKLSARRLRLFGAIRQRRRKNTTPEGIVEAGEEGNDRDVIQKREVAADDQNDLKNYQQHAGDVAGVTRTKREPRHD